MKPFLYAIADVEGRPVLDEICVAEHPSELELGDDAADKGMKIVPVYTGPQIEAMRGELNVRKGELHAVEYMLARRLRGSVEGRPTATINYLQRVDELVAIEALHGKAIELIQWILDSVAPSDSDGPPRLTIRHSLGPIAWIEHVRIRFDAVRRQASNPEPSRPASESVPANGEASNPERSGPAADAAGTQDVAGSADAKLLDSEPLPEK